MSATLHCAWRIKLLGPSLDYSYRIVDVRDFNGERLLESPQVGDNIVAILTTLPDRRASIHRIVRRIAGLGPGERESALMRLLILAGLRSLSRKIEKRFGTIPKPAQERLSELSIKELEVVGLRLLDATSLEEMLGEAPRG